MTTDVDNTEADFIVVGSGHASADCLPDLCSTLGNRLRGVVFIDHDVDEIRTLQAKMDAQGVKMLDIVLRKRVLEREVFNEIRAELGLENHTHWDEDIPNNPPMIRLQARLRKDEIFNAIWGLLPTEGGRLTLPRVRIIFAFGMTGMTSSTVALESGEIIRSELARHMGSRTSHVGGNVIDAPPPIHIGIGLFPPDPMEGAGDFNLPHGLNVARVVQEKLPSRNARINELADKPFNRFFFIDASGFDRVQNLIEFDKWAAKTVSTMLLCESINGESFYDSAEFFDGRSPYSNCALILLGVSPDEQPTVQLLREISPKIEVVESASDEDLPTHAQGLLDETAETALRTPDSPFTRARSALDDAVSALRETREELAAARSTPFRFPIWWVLLGAILGMLIGGAGTFGVEVYVLRYTTVEVITIINAMIILISGAAAGAIVGAFVGFLIPFLAHYSYKKMLISTAQSAEVSRLSELKYALTQLKSSVQDSVAAISAEWGRRQFSQMWLLPLPAAQWVHDLEDHSFPTSEDTQAGYESVTTINDELQRMLRHIVNPSADSAFQVKRGTALVAGSATGRRNFPLPENSLRAAFGGEWIILEGEGNLDDSVPVHYLLFWEPEDGEIKPRYFRQREGEIFGLPAQFNAWPVLGTYVDAPIAE